MTEKIIIELTSEQYSMLMFILNQFVNLKGTSTAHYAERLLVAIEKSSRVEKERDGRGSE